MAASTVRSRGASRAHHRRFGRSYGALARGSSCNGSRTETVSDFSQNGTLEDQTVTTTSADGLSVTTQVDATGGGTFDVTRTDVTVLNADGSTTETVSDFSANGTRRTPWRKMPSGLRGASRRRENSILLRRASVPAIPALKLQHLASCIFHLVRAGQMIGRRV
jgi:hypothetical protein